MFHLRIFPWIEHNHINDIHPRANWVHGVIKWIPFVHYRYSILERAILIDIGPGTEYMPDGSSGAFTEINHYSLTLTL